MPVRIPDLRRTVPLDQMSKRQLAGAYNAEVEKSRQLQTHVQAAMRVLLAMMLSPEAFHHQGGNQAYVDMEAIRQVQNGMTLRIDEEGEQMRLRLEMDAPVIHTSPSIHGLRSM